MKKIVALVLCLAMMVGLMTGCQKKMDAETLYQKMNEAVKGSTAQSLDAQLELDLSFATMGMTIDMGFDIGMGMEMKTDLSAVHVDMTLDMDVLGQNEKTTMDVYVAVDGDNLVTYVYEGASDTWIKSTEGDIQQFMAEYQALAQELESDALPKGVLTLAEEQVTVGERKCYVLTEQMDGETMQGFMSQYMDQILAEAMEAEGAELDAESQEVLDLIKNMDWSKLNYTVVYHVDAETFLPRETAVEIQGIGDVFNEMFSTLMASALMGDLAGEIPDFTIEVPACKMTMKNMAYNDEVTVPAVPQEAIDNAIDGDELLSEEEYYEEEIELTNPPQEDGSYLMMVGNTAVRISVPAKFEVYMSEVDYLATMTAEMEEMADYMVVEGYTAAEIQESYDLQVQTSKDEGTWVSNEELESINGFTVVNLVYNDGIYEVTAWREVPGGLVLVCASSFDALPNVEEILTGIEIGQ